MRFIVDANLPPLLARYLVQLGHDAEHVADQLLLWATDAAIWNYALQADAAIVTKDKDFAQRKILAIGGPVVVSIRISKLRLRDLIQ